MKLYGFHFRPTTKNILTSNHAFDNLFCFICCTDSFLQRWRRDENLLPQSFHLTLRRNNLNLKRSNKTGISTFWKTTYRLWWQFVIVCEEKCHSFAYFCFELFSSIAINVLSFTTKSLVPSTLGDSWILSSITCQNLASAANGWKRHLS